METMKKKKLEEIIIKKNKFILRNFFSEIVI